MNDARASLHTFRPDVDKTFVTVMVPTAPRTTYSTSAPDPTHVPMMLSLRQLYEAMKEADRG